MTIHETYILRCLELAALGAGHVSPNPMVGAVLVHENRIIGEGYHQAYGGGHAEVNCLNSVPEACRPLISKSTLYVSLEPCAHYGKTPPCADLIIENRIPKVYIGCLDPFAEVDGKGMRKLLSAGVEAVSGVLEKECAFLNRRFFTFHQQQRPYVLLKWAETGDRKIAGADHSRLYISHPLTNRISHKWRSEEAALLVGTRTALYDDPSLTNRLWNGPSPVRAALDMQLRIPGSHKLFDRQSKTIIFNGHRQEEQENLVYWRLDKTADLTGQLLSALYSLKLTSVMIEGGRMLLQSFIDAGLWDEARTITHEGMTAGEGIASPSLRNEKWVRTESSGSDTIRYYVNARSGIDY